MRLISWNVAGRVRSTGAQIRAVLDRDPDLVCLQELRSKTAPEWAEALRGAGLPHSVNSFGLAPNREILTGPRRYGELIACRWRLDPLPQADFNVPWPEKIVSAVAACPTGFLEVHTAHVPPGASNGWTKIDTFNGMFARLACPSPIPRILCGDFNSPQHETSAGEIVTWGQRPVEGGFVHWGRSGGRTGREWDAGERSVLAGLAEHDLPDAFRSLHGYDRQEFSWYLARKAQGAMVRRRFDHVFASRRLRVRACRYLHAFREDGLSDHASMELDFSMRPDAD